jgi:predicted transcriptional regulator
MDRDAELPPPLEMVCLSALWRIGEGTVAEVRKEAMRDKPLAYTTVLTLLDRLTRRTAVARRKEGRSFRYRPAVAREDMRKRALVRFVAAHFDGSVDELHSFIESSRTPPDAARAAHAS